MSNTRIFRYFKISPEIISLAVMTYVRYPLSLRNVEDLLPECGIDITHETVSYWWNRLGAIFAAEIRGTWSRRCGIASIGAGISTRCL
jgi:putative transposase